MVFLNFKSVYTLIGIIVFAILPGKLSSQTECFVEGNIKDKLSNSPVGGVNIRLKPSNDGAVSNADGYYRIGGVKPGTYTIIVTHVGYKDIKQEVVLAAGVVFKQDFHLESDVKTLAPVIVEGVSYNKEPYGVSKIESKQMEEDAIRDIGDYLRSVPNVAAVRKGGSGLDPVVRGFKYSQLNIQLDHGMKIEGGCPSRMDPTASHVEPEDVESIEVFKGPYALKYGPSLGGVVNINTFKPIPYDKFQLNVKAIRGYESNWNGHREYLRINGGEKRLYFDLSGTRKNYGNYKDGNGNDIFASFRKYSYKAQLGINPIDNHSVILSYGEYHARDVRYPALQMDEREDNTRLMSLDYKAVKITPWLNELRVKVYESKVEHIMDNKYRGNSDTTAAVAYADPVNTGGRIEGIMSFGVHNLTVGADYENIVKDGTRTKNMIAMAPGLSGLYGVKVEKLWSDAEINNLGIFGEYTVSLGAYSLLGIARVDINDANSGDIIVKNPGGANIFHYASDSAGSNYLNLSGAIGATRHINEKLSVSLSAGRGVRSPDMLERFIMLLPVGYDNFDYVGNPQLKPETNTEVDLTIKYQDIKYGVLEFNAFYSYVTNFIIGKRLPASVQNPLTPNVLGVKKYVNAEPVNLKGFELAWSTPTKQKIMAKLSAAYTMGTISKIDKFVLNQSGSVISDDELKNDPLPEIPPFEGNITLGYKTLKDKIQLSAGCRIVAAQKLVSEAMYEPQTPGFALANAALTYYHNKFLSATAGVNNLFNRAYYEHLNRKIIGSKERMYEPGRVFFVNVILNI